MDERPLHGPARLPSPRLAYPLPRAPFPRASLPPLSHKHGTTTLGMRLDSGVVLAVDSRASTGQYVASQTVRKVLEINPYLLGTMAGGAADCQFWFRVLARECRLWELRNGTRISVGAASKILANITYGYRNYGLSMGSMVAGYDQQKGYGLYYVDDQGDRIAHSVFAVGSGSVFAYGVVDAEYRPGMGLEEGVELARRAIYHATTRDCFSGGIVTVYVVTSKGWTRVSSEDQTELKKRYG